MTATTVAIRLYRPGPLGDTDNPAEGVIECVPTRRRHIEDGDPDDYIVLPAKFSARLGAALLDEDGETELQAATPGVAWAQLEPTDAGAYENAWAWRFTERTSNGTTRYCFVPTSGSVVEYGDLEDVDPATFDPDPEAMPAWIADLAEEAEARTATDDALADAIAAVESSDVDSVAGLSGIVTAADLKTALSLPSDTSGDLDTIDDTLAGRLSTVSLIRSYAGIFGVYPGENPAAAYDALVADGGGELRFLPGAHTGLALTLDEAVPTLVTGRGATIAPSTAGVAFTLNAGAQSVPPVVLDGLEIDGTSVGGSAGSAKGVVIRDHYGATVINSIISNLGGGVLLTDETDWSESSVLDNLLIDYCMVGVDLTPGGGTGSFRYARWGQVHVDHTPTGGTSVRLGTGAQLAFSAIQLLQCHSPNDDFTHFYIDGNLQGARIKMHAEATNAGVDRYAVELGPNGNLDGSDFSLSIGGNGFTQDVRNASALVYQVQGYKKGSDVLASTSSSRVYQVFQPGDTNQRFHIAGDGTLAWGTGSGSTDVSLWRPGASTLRADGELQARRTATGNRALSTTINGESVLRLAVNADGTHYWSDGTNPADAELRRTASGTMKLLNASLDVERASSGNRALAAQVDGDTVARAAISAGGTIAFSPGNTVADVTLARSGAGTLKSDGELLAERASGSNRAHSARTAGDSGFRTAMLANGTIAFADGTAAADINLSRSGVGTLKSDSELLAERATGTNRGFTARTSGDAGFRTALLANGTLAFADGTNAADSNVSRSGSGTLKSDAELLAERASSGNRALSARVSGDTVARFSVAANGTISLGPGGSTAADTTIGRDSAGVVAIGGTTGLGCLRTGRAATGSRPAAATVGQGSQFFDTTLNKPIWSTGSAWVDATGASV